MQIFTLDDDRGLSYFYGSIFGNQRTIETVWAGLNPPCQRHYLR